MHLPAIFAFEDLETKCVAPFSKNSINRALEVARLVGSIKHLVMPVRSGGFVPGTGKRINQK